MTPRIFIAIACHNRRAVAEQCLPTMRDSIQSQDYLALFNDGSDEYDASWLRQFTRNEWDNVISREKPAGIQAQRREHLRLFLISEMTHLYLTDHDVIHDPTWRENALRLQAAHGHAPLCLYDTQAHVRLAGNTLEDRPESEVIWRCVAPGVSYLLTREHVERVAPHLPFMRHFDWEIPALLGSRFAVSRVGYCDHIGWQGAHHPVEEGLDGGDRVLRPTPYLVKKRAEVVAALGQMV